MVQLRKMGLQFDNIIGESTLCTEQVINLAKEAVEGVERSDRTHRFLRCCPASRNWKSGRGPVQTTSRPERPQRAISCPT